MGLRVEKAAYSNFAALMIGQYDRQRNSGSQSGSTEIKLEWCDHNAYVEKVTSTSIYLKIVCAQNILQVTCVHLYFWNKSKIDRFQ